jgi:iron(III) transport system permease protein
VNTVLLSAGSGLLAGIIGIATAWTVSQYDFPGRRVLRWALVLPLALPLYVAAHAFGGLFEYTGPVNSVWAGVYSSVTGRGPADIPYITIRNLPGLILVSSLTLYPYVYLTARNWFDSQAARLLEAGRSLTSEVRTVFRLGVPISRPALVGGMALVIMETLNEYGAPIHFGVSTLTTGIFRTWFALADVQAALRLAAILLAFVFLLLVGERLSRGKARFAPEAPASAATARRRLRGGSAVAVLVLTSVPVLLGFVAPVAQLLDWGAHAALTDWSSLLPLLLRSLGLAAAAAVGIGAVALVLAHHARQLPVRVGSSVAQIATVGYAVPGAVIAIGMLQFGRVVSAELSGVVLIGTVALLLGAYLVRFLGVAYHPTQAGFELAGSRLRESALSLGASGLGALFRAELPVMGRVLGGAVVLVFVDVLKELPLTLILRPFDFETLATATFRLAGDERLVEAAIPALTLVAAGCLAVLVLDRILGGEDAATI